MQHPELGEHRQPVDEPLEHDACRCAAVRRDRRRTRWPGTRVLDQRQSRHRDVVAGGLDERVTEAGDPSGVDCRRTANGSRRTRWLSLRHVDVAERSVGIEVAVEERAEHTVGVSCTASWATCEVEDLGLVVHGATYSGLNSSIPPLRAAGCTVTTSQKFSGAMIGNSGGPHSRYADGTDVSNTLSLLVIAVGDDPHTLMWLAVGIVRRGAVTGSTSELAVVAQRRAPDRHGDHHRGRSGSGDPRPGGCGPAWRTSP